MILAAIEIENYKQYGGLHHIDFPEQGMIAITGPNGAGKTTLFEAIEWCLYGPRTIALATIPPHGGVGNTRVRVTLQDPHAGRRFVVQRELRQSGTQAEVYSEDQTGQAVVQGPRDVTEHVAKSLIGLPHAAFVSTFFTRQKELTFFGDRTPTDRRVEVARLLGFQAIRDAQDEIGEERNQARHAAVSLSAQYDRDSAGRDFTSEIAQTDAAVGAAQVSAATCQLRLTNADAAYSEARGELERWRGLQERDATQQRELLTIAGTVQAAFSRRQSAEAELVRLQALNDERTGLAVDAALIAELSSAVSAMEAERELARRIETLHQSVRMSADQLAGTAHTLQKIVADHQEAAAGLEGWFWADGDQNNPCQASARLLQAVSAVNHRQARQHAELLRRAFDLSSRIEAAKKNLDSYRSFRQGLVVQRDALRGDGDPEVRLCQAEADVARAQSALEQALSELTAARRERQGSAELERIFDERSFDRRCPTCTRPLSDEEAARLVRSLRGATERLRENESARERQAADARAGVAAAESVRAAASDLVQKIQSLIERLADGERMISEIEAEHARDVADLGAVLAAVEIHAPPDLLAVEVADATADRAAQIAALAGTLEQLGQRAAVARDMTLEADREIVALGAVDYDASAHQVTVKSLESARRAAAEIKRIDIELRAKESYEATKSAAERDLADLERQTRNVEAMRAEIGFDLEALQRAKGEEANAAGEQQAAREEAVSTREALRDAQSALQRVIDERDRLEKLAADADRKTREADELDRMYREFAEFDKYVADHVGPLLAETTERLLGQVTDGKYDRVRFDENYGIEVFDGDECFRLEGFSGGERDVVALCARLAMSELVGSAALRPPRFLVLDEVFGSLDSERRAQLLETLGSLSSSGHFQQMFIISHVDDVQLSPAMNEAWTIEERDGVSHVVRPELLVASLT